MTDFVIIEWSDAVPDHDSGWEAIMSVLELADLFGDDHE